MGGPQGTAGRERPEQVPRGFRTQVSKPQAGNRRTGDAGVVAGRELMRLVCGTLKPGSLGKLRGKRPQVKIRIIITESMPQEGVGLPPGRVLRLRGHTR